MSRKIRRRPIDATRPPIRLFPAPARAVPAYSLGEEIIRRLAADNLPPPRFAIGPGRRVVARGEEARARRAGR